EVQPGGDLWAADESGPAEWTLDSLAARARQLRIIGLYTQPPAGATVVCADDYFPLGAIRLMAEAAEASACRAVSTGRFGANYWTSALGR
ncbi:hypothetical protein ACFWDI_40715, partial [Streptomyces sp. NPDC060064]